QVVDVDPGPPLRAAPDATPETEAEEPRERRERAALSREHEPDAQRGGAHTVAGRGAGLLLPCHAEIREEALAGGRRLLEPPVAPGAVVADGRGAHEGGWALARGQRCDRLDQGARRVDAAPPDALAARARERTGEDRLAGEVHDRRTACQRARGQ